MISLSSTFTSNLEMAAILVQHYECRKLLILRESVAYSAHYRFYGDDVYMQFLSLIQIHFIGLDKTKNHKLWRGNLEHPHVHFLRRLKPTYNVKYPCNFGIEGELPKKILLYPTTWTFNILKVK